MNQKPTLTYIENNQEKTVTLNFFNHQKMFEKIFKIKQSYKDIYSYTPYCDIELIHIKNYTFKNSLRIGRNYHYVSYSKGPIIILENCIFESDLLDIEGNNVEIINPIFLKNSEIEIRNSKVVDITLNEDSKNIDLKIDRCKEVTINASSCLKNLETWEGKKLTIKNLTTPLDNSSCIFYPKELIIEDSKLKNTTIKCDDKMTLRNSELKDIGLNDFYFIKEINLENSTIISEIEIKIPELTKLEFNDKKNLPPSSLQANTYIQIGKNKFINNEKEKPLIISEASLKNDVHLIRQNLLLTLKELRKKIDTNVELSLSEKNKILTNEIKEYDTVRNLELQQEIQRRKSIIERELNYKKEEANTKLDKTKNYLLSRPISTYSNSFKVNTKLEDKNKTRQLRKKEFIKELDRRKRLTQNKNN